MTWPLAASAPVPMRRSAWLNAGVTVGDAGALVHPDVTIGSDRNAPASTDDTDQPIRAMLPIMLRENRGNHALAIRGAPPRRRIARVRTATRAACGRPPSQA